jgi:hypothetical protein
MAVPLARYAQITDLSECLLMGVRRDQDLVGGCDRVFTKRERDLISKYLLEAQQEIEDQISYPLVPKWFASEEAYYKWPLHTYWKKVIEAGIRATAAIEEGAIVDHAADPAVVTVTTAVDIDEIIVYHPDTEVEIHPSAMVRSGGDVIISIPRCRMVKATLADEQPETGWDYNDISNFEETVDVIRVYNDSSTNAVLIWPHQCSCSGGCSLCSDYRQDGCIYIRNAETGALDIAPANFSSGAWSSTALCCSGKPEKVLLNYRAGLPSVSYQHEDTVTRLAHSKMPSEPCGCDFVIQVWRRDRNVPDVLTRERINCPFGLSDGAWIAWKFTQALRYQGASVL